MGKYMVHDHEWLDRIDLTPGLALSAKLVEHPKAGPLIEIVSSCPSGPMESRCAPRGWFKSPSGMSMPVLPAGWDQARLAKALAFEMPNMEEDGVVKASEDRQLALLVLAASTKHDLDKEHASDPIRSLKRAGLSDFDPWDKAWIAIGEPVAMEDRPKEGTCRALVPLDCLGSWLEGVQGIKARMAKLGRPFAISASLEGSPLADWRALSRAGRKTMFKEVGSLELAPGELLWGMDPGCGGGGSFPMKPGSYRAFLSREEGLNLSLCVLAESEEPSAAHAAQGWGSPARFEIHVDAGLAGFFKGPEERAGKPLAEGRYEKVCEATSEEVAAGSWEWGVACSSGEGDGSYWCEPLVNAAGEFVGARVVFGEPSPKAMEELRDASMSMSAREQAEAISKAASKASAPSPKRPRM